MRVLLEARLGSVRIPLQIDVGVGDAIVPVPEELEFPTLLKSPGVLLGLQEIEKPEVLAGRGGCWFKLGTRQPHVGVKRDFRPANKAHPAFSVDAIEELFGGTGSSRRSMQLRANAGGR